MEEAEVKVLISVGSTVLCEWKEVHSSSLPETLNSLKHLKESINNFLTDLILKKKNSTSKEFLRENKESYNVLKDVEDEGLEEDPLTEILGKIMNVTERNSEGEYLKKGFCIIEPKRLKK